MLEEHIPGFLTFLKDRRYACSTIVRYRAVACEFAIYLAGRVASSEEITSEHVQAYAEVRSRISHELWKRPLLPRYAKGVVVFLAPFLDYLRSQGIRMGIPIREAPDPRAVTGHEQTLAAYERFLRDDRGLSLGTVRNYLEPASRLCQSMVETHTESWDDLTADFLYEHLRGQARELRHSSFRVAETALRSFFRFLRLTERTRRDLDAFLIRYRNYSLSRVPRAVSIEDIQRVFDDLKTDTPSNIRDRAIFLLLTLYGLRIGEVARLCMEDVRWRCEQIVIRRRKAGRDLVLPLHPAVAHALLQHVDTSRPRGTPYREVFLTRYFPHPYRCGSLLGDVVQARLRKLGLNTHPHAFRHALATRLINNDCPPEWIQILLGHRRFASTLVYAKVDLAHLREVSDNDGVRP